MKKISIILAAFLLGGCAVTQINENYEQILLKDDANLTANFGLKREWWRGYNEPRLNELIGHSRSEERRVGKECRSRWSP